MLVVLLLVVVVLLGAVLAPLLLRPRSNRATDGPPDRRTLLASRRDAREKTARWGGPGGL